MAGSFARIPIGKSDPTIQLCIFWNDDEARNPKDANTKPPRDQNPLGGLSIF